MDLTEHILLKVRLEGPVRVFISPDEYEHLKVEIRRIWKEDWSLRKEEHQLLMMAYLRGFTFYRDFSEQDNHFWDSFFRDLKLPFPTDQELWRSPMWRLLSSHAETRNVCAEYWRQEVVNVVRKVWGSGILLRHLKPTFSAYYTRCVDMPVTQKLLTDLGCVDPEQHLIYQRLLPPLVRVVDYILDNQLELLGPDALTDRLLNSGLDLGQPNVVVFLEAKSRDALHVLVDQIKGTPRRRIKPRLTRSQRLPRQKTGTLVNVALCEGYYFSPFFTIEVQVDPSLVFIEYQLEHDSDDTVLEKMKDKIVIRNAPVGRNNLLIRYYGAVIHRVPFVVLPDLQWSFPEVPAVVFEHEMQWGEVHLPGEESPVAVFTWRPEGKYISGSLELQSIPVEVRVEISDDLDCQFSVKVPLVGARVVDAETESEVTTIYRPEDFDRVRLRVLSGSMKCKATVFLESQPEQVAVQPFRTLSEFKNRDVSRQDHLRVALQVKSRTGLPVCLPVHYQPGIEAVEVDAAGLLVRCTHWEGCVLRVVERSTSVEVEHTYPLRQQQPVRITFKLPDSTTARNCKLLLMQGSDLLASSEVVVDACTSFEAWAALGIGI